MGRRVLRFTELTVHPGSAAPGRLLSSLAEEGTSCLLALAPAGGWDRQGQDRPVEGGDRLAVVATRAGLAQLLRASKAGRVPVAPRRDGPGT